MHEWRLSIEQIRHRIPEAKTILARAVVMRIGWEMDNEICAVETTDGSKILADSSADARPELSAHEVAYDPITDTLTINGCKFTGALLCQLTTTPCGVMFRIVKRKDGVITISQERDPLASLAPDMLEALQSAISVLLDDFNYAGKARAIVLARRAIALADGCAP